jgi:hypothetical protein
VTASSNAISDVSNKNFIYPVLMGSAYNLWNPSFGEPYGYVDSEFVSGLLSKAKRGANTNRSAYSGEKIVGIKDLALSKARIAFRLITNQTNTRTGIFCLVPPGVVLGHGSPYLHRRKGDAKTDAFLIGVLSSIPFDWYARRWVEINFTFELLKPMPIPIFNIKDKKVLRLVELSAKLSYRDKKYNEWINEIGLDLEILSSSFDVSEDVSEIDAIVSLLYGLSLNQVEHIYENFHRGWNYAERLDKVKNFYEKWCK